MKNLLIDWDSIPDVMNKNQFYRLCHISKSTALHLLKSGKAPYERTCKKTRCCKIKKENAKAYLQEIAIYSELYSAPMSGTVRTKWRSFQKNSPKMCFAICTIITQTYSAIINML